MKKIIVLIAILLSFSGSSAEHAYYSADLCKSIDRKAIILEAETALNALQNQKKAIGEFIARKTAEKDLLSDCYRKRFEIILRSSDYIRSLLGEQDPEAPLFLRQTVRELNTLLKYFKEAEAQGSFHRNDPAEKVIDIRTFGAVGDGKTNDAPAFAKAIEYGKKAVGKEKVRIFVPAGTYLFGTYQPSRTIPADKDGWRKASPDFSSKGKGWNDLHVPLMRGMKNFTIEGEKGTILLGADPRIGFFLPFRSSRIVFRDLVFDYQTLPFTQGTVTECSPEKMEVKISLDPNMPAPDLDHILKANSLYTIAHTPDGKRRTSAFTRIAAVKGLGENTYAIRFKGKNLRGIGRGTRLAIVARYNNLNSNILYAHECSWVLYENITVHASPACVYGGRMVHCHHVIGCRIGPPAGSGRLVGCNADPFMLGGTRIGAYLSGCVFEHAGDDTANQYIGGCKVMKISKDGRTADILHGGQILPGHMISLLDPNTGLVRAESMVITSEFIPGTGNKRVTLETPFPADITTMDSVKQRELNAKEAFAHKNNPSFQRGRIPFIVIDQAYTGSGTIITGNTFRNAYRGVLSKVSNMLLENNVIEGMDREAESIMAYLHFWREAHPAHNILIRNNLFRNNGGGVSSYYEIYGAHQAPGRMPFRYIAVENNKFINSKKSDFSNCQGIRITGNYFDKDSILSFGVSRNITVERNRFELPEEKAVRKSPNAASVHFERNVFSADSFWDRLFFRVHQ